jgi:hypothetical protein
MWSPKKLINLKTIPKSMIEVSLKPDKLTSLLVCYHILCAPTERNTNYNPDVFEKLNSSLTNQEKDDYLTFLSIVAPNDTDGFRTQLFFPKYITLDEFLNGNEARNVSKEIRASIKEFEKSFNSYWENIEEEFNIIKECRLKLAKEHITQIYELQERLTGETGIPRPSHLEIRIVEGLSPSSFGNKDHHPLHYTIEQKRNYLDEGAFLRTIIHESNIHNIARLSANFHKQIFGRWIYEVEEGFVKTMTAKIYTQLTGNPIDYGGSKGTLEESGEIFNANWDRLNGNFKPWYEDRLFEIKDKFNL